MREKKTDHLRNGDEIYEGLLEKLTNENEDDEDFSEEELDVIFNALDVAREKAYPNLERVGCPDSQTLREMALHPEIALKSEKMLSHIWKCAPCTYEIREYVEEYRKTTGEA